MKWAGRRRIIAVAIVAAFLLVIGILFYSLFLTPNHSCFDGKMNGSEEGVDCGGGCLHLCQSQVRSPFVEFSQLVSNGSTAGVIVHVQNPNREAEVVGLEYKISILSSSGLVLFEDAGDIDVLPNSTRGVFKPIPQNFFQPGVQSSTIVSGGTFIKADEQANFLVESFEWESLNSNPVLNVMLRSVVDKVRVPITATLFSVSGEVVGASEITIPEIQAGINSIFFTWNEPFDEIPVRVEILF